MRWYLMNLVRLSEPVLRSSLDYEVSLIKINQVTNFLLFPLIYYIHNKFCIVFFQVQINISTRV
jgi:hypothetical protein